MGDRALGNYNFVQGLIDGFGESLFPEVVEIREVWCTMALHHEENCGLCIKNKVDFKLSLNQA